MSEEIKKYQIVGFPKTVLSVNGQAPDENGNVEIEVPEGGSSSPAIIDVVELPTENINENVFYRFLSGSIVINQYVYNTYTIHCVETLPESGLPATNIDQTEGNVYYNVADGEAYGYVDDMLSAGLSVPAGWYPGDTLLGALGFGYSGVITDITDDPRDDTFRLLLEYVVYQYKDKWVSLKPIGHPGTGVSAEVFNHPSNKATGNFSHAEGAHSHAEGSSSHAEGCESHAEGSFSHAEGSSSHAEGNSSHAEGLTSHAEGDFSHAEGNCSHAEGGGSHAEGNNTHAAGRAQHVQGEYNIVDPEYDVNNPHVRGKYAHIVGNGTADDNRSNAHTLDWSGNGWFAGNIYVGGTSQDDPTAKRLLTEDDIPEGGSASAIPDDEMLELLAEMGVVDPISNENGAVYTDTNDKLYVL
jgi:hypothetical protein